MTPTAANIARNLLHARQRCGLSQEDVAGRLGVTRKSISHWETAYRGSLPSLRTLSRLADVYGTRIESLTRSEA